jgi:multiple sugar transport system substrate-binding protein
MKFLRLPALILSVLLLTSCMVNQGGGTPGGTVTPQPGNNAAVTQPGGADERVMPPMNTTDQITLRYAIWDDYNMTQYLADRFNEKYPNITIEIVRLPPGGYNEALMALAADNDFPDIFQYLGGLQNPINNGWLYDFTEFWDNDPEIDFYLDSLKPNTKIDGQRAMIMAAEYLPQVAFLDRSVFNRLNVPMPDYNWTYQEMLELVRTMTRPDQNIYGYNYYLGLITWAPVVLNDALSEFGWDGQNYQFEGAWADAVNLVAEFERNGNQPIMWSDEWAAASGDAGMWPGNSGLVAMQFDAWWTLNNIYSKSEAIEKGVDMIPYVVPRGAGTLTNRKPAFIDFAGISAATKHPREAYEALVFMNISREGWMHRIDAFPIITDDAGNIRYDLPNCLPLNNCDEVWAAYRKLYPPDPSYDAFFALAREPVPLGGPVIPGFEMFMAEIYFGGDYNGEPNIELAVRNGLIDAHDVAADFNVRAREYYERAMEEFFLMYGRVS